jgi:hypothetical protein
MYDTEQVASLLRMAIRALQAIAIGPDNPCCLQKLAAITVDEISDIAEESDCVALIDSVRLAIIQAEDRAASFYDCPPEDRCKNCTFDNRRDVKVIGKRSEIFNDPALAD